MTFDHVFLKDDGEEEIFGMSPSLFKSAVHANNSPIGFQPDEDECKPLVQHDSTITKVENHEEFEDNLENALSAASTGESNALPAVYTDEEYEHGHHAIDDVAKQFLNATSVAHVNEEYRDASADIDIQNEAEDDLDYTDPTAEQDNTVIELDGHSTVEDDLDDPSDIEDNIIYEIRPDDDIDSFELANYEYNALDDPYATPFAKDLARRQLTAFALKQGAVEPDLDGNVANDSNEFRRVVTFAAEAISQHFNEFEFVGKTININGRVYKPQVKITTDVSYAPVDEDQASNTDTDSSHECYEGCKHHAILIDDSSSSAQTQSNIDYSPVSHHRSSLSPSFRVPSFSKRSITTFDNNEDEVQSTSKRPRLMSTSSMYGPPDDDKETIYVALSDEEPEPAHQPTPGWDSQFDMPLAGPLGKDSLTFGNFQHEKGLYHNDACVLVSADLFRGAVKDVMYEQCERAEDQAILIDLETAQALQRRDAWIEVTKARHEGMAVGRFRYFNSAKGLEYYRASRLCICWEECGCSRLCGRFGDLRCPCSEFIVYL